MKNKNFLALAVVFLGALILVAFTIPQDQKKGGPWSIPDKYKTMKNPYTGNADVTNVGKMLYAKHCKSCHGNIGLGDGPKAATLPTSCGDLSSAAWQKANSDGALYYMSIIGRDDMPNFESKIPEEEDRWGVVNYLRTLTAQ